MFLLSSFLDINFLNIASSRLARSDTLSTLRASDHAIISVCFSLRMITPPASRPVPLEVLQTPYFKSLLHTCLHLHHCHTFPVSQLLSELNSSIEDVASHTKDFLHAIYDLNTWDSLQKLVTSDQHVLFMKHQRLNIASRRVWQNNWQLAQKLLANQHVLNDLIVVSNKSVKLKYPNTFSIKFEEAKHVAIQK